MDSIPSFDSTQDEHKARPRTIGMVPSLFESSSGCSFQDRCPRVLEECRGSKGTPVLYDYKEKHKVSCFNPFINLRFKRVILNEFRIFVRGQ